MLAGSRRAPQTTGGRGPQKAACASKRTNRPTGHPQVAPMTRPKRLTTLAELDGRTMAARQVRETMAAIESDLGGDLTTAQKAIVERAAITSAVLSDMATNWLTTGQLDAVLWATLSNLERRLYESIGLDRVARDVTPTIDEIAQQIEASKNES